MKINKIIMKCILVLLVVSNYLLILNLSARDLMKEEYIEKALSNVSIIDVINSDKLQDNQYIIDTKNTLNKLYKIAEILNISEDKVNQIIDSRISKNVLTKIFINIADSIIIGKDMEIFYISDYNEIVDNNIDLVIKEIELDLDEQEKEILVKILKEIGEKLIHDMPSTNKITRNLSVFENIIIKLLISTSSRNILLLVNIILYLILIFMVNRSILKKFGTYFISLILLLLISCIIISYFSLTFNGEWLFIRQFILYYVSKLIVSLLVLVLLLIIYSIIKRKV